jgi:hypothetical protein
MKKLLLTTLAALIMLGAGTSYAHTYQVKSDMLGRKQIYQDGSLVAMAKSTKDGITQYFDNDRIQIGYSKIASDGSVVYFNAENVLIGSSIVGMDGVTYYYDNKEKLIGNSKTEPNNALMFFDVVIKNIPNDGSTYTRKFAM